MTPPKLGWLAWEAAQDSGYAHVSYNYRMAFTNMGVQFANAYKGDYDLLTALCTPTHWMVEDYVRTGRVREPLVLHTMFEASPLPPGWIENLNSVGLIWVPSQYCVDLFRNAGVTRPIVKTPYGIDHAAYEYVDRSHHSGPMRFGIWADILHGRKNVLKAVHAFVDAALPDAELEVKLHSFVGMSDATTFADSQGRPLANISIHAGVWPRPKLVKWLHSLDCMIYLSGGEGFGLMPLEAAATGMTTICHNCTGMQEYLNPDAFYLVDSDGEEKAMSYTIGHGYPCMMPKPNYEQAVEQIRYAYQHREETVRRGGLANLVAQEYTWENAATQSWEYIKDYYETHIEPFKATTA